MSGFSLADRVLRRRRGTAVPDGPGYSEAVTNGSTPTSSAPPARTVPVPVHLLEAAVEVVRRAARGDMEARITGIHESEGDFAELLWGINDSLDRSDAFVREAGASLEYVSRGQYFREVAETGTVGDYALAARTINGARQAMQTKVDAFRSVVGEFETTSARLLEEVAHSARELEATAAGLETSANEAKDTATTVAGAAEQGAANVQAVAGAVEQVSGSIGEISSQVTKSSATVDAAVGHASEGRDEIDELGELADQIGSVVQIIDSIADKTNLLALNATIEAARAGEAGKGFAVVASEVKTLAQQTSGATDEIQGNVTGIQSSTSRSVESFRTIEGDVRGVREAFGAIAAAVEEQDVTMQEIARNVSEAARGMHSVAENVVSISDSAERTRRLTSDLRAAADAVAHEGSELGSAISSFLGEVRAVV